MKAVETFCNLFAAPYMTLYYIPYLSTVLHIEKLGVYPRSFVPKLHMLRTCTGCDSKAKQSTNTTQLFFTGSLSRHFFTPRGQVLFK